MKRPLLLFLLCLLSTGANAQIYTPPFLLPGKTFPYYNGSASCQSTQQFSGCTTAGIDTTGATLLVATVTCYSVTLTAGAVTDAYGNSWTQLSTTANSTTDTA